jgi:hypothetical protein
VDCFPGKEQVHADNHEIKPGIIAGVESAQVYGHQAYNAAYVERDKISVDIGKLAWPCVAHNEVLDEDNEGRDQSIDPEPRQKLFWHGEIIEDEKRWNKRESQSREGLQPVMDDAVEIVAENVNIKREPLRTLLLVSLVHLNNGKLLVYEGQPPLQRPGVFIFRLTAAVSPLVF